MKTPIILSHSTTWGQVYQTMIIDRSRAAYLLKAARSRRLRKPERVAGGWDLPDCGVALRKWAPPSIPVRSI